MAKYRRDRINDAVAKELNLALPEIHDPRVQNNLITFTRAEVAPDLKYAKVYVSIMGNEEEAMEGLARTTGMLRHHLASTLNLRITPELAFCVDHSIEHGARIAQILEEIHKKDAAREQEKKEKEQNGEL